jgi:hypothetical protein
MKQKYLCDSFVFYQGVVEAEFEFGYMVEVFHKPIHAVIANAGAEEGVYFVRQFTGEPL